MHIFILIWKYKGLEPISGLEDVKIDKVKQANLDNLSYARHTEGDQGQDREEGQVIQETPNELDEHGSKTWVRLSKEMLTRRGL